ncbi:PepSY domain-containing protein [Mangrovimonas cancribranchiae]|uniref:PepSY domain-containing protein n=1 Tax=Mangrovimonas cancribranchiae TaxID=3080055 RepID=A0AAU6NWT1_9FLAO
MTISIWRYSHLALAVSSFVFIVLASVTGIILAFQPISEQMEPYNVADLDNITLAETVVVFQNTYPEIIDIKVDANDFVIATVFTEDGNDLSGYFNPKTAEFLGEELKPSPFFQWVTNFHRSLFLKSVGRFFVGLCSFLLCLIAVTGTILIVKRQRGVKRFFTKIINDDFNQYWHVILGRLSLLPIIIITVTGVYLSLEKFDALPETKTAHNIDYELLSETPKQDVSHFSIFTNTSLSEVKHIEFPFSSDVEDYFTVKLHDKDLLVNQFTGAILSEVNTPKVEVFSALSFNLHTGKGSILWSIILAVATANILFFVYSGFAMTLKRRKSRLKNKFKAEDAEIVILVGSENGSTINYANTFFKQLIKQNKKAFIAEMNAYTQYPNAKHLVVMTATYGQGDAPTNASQFFQKLNENTNTKDLKFSVVGFGSLAYPDFCQFAYDVDKKLQQMYTPILPIFTINDKSIDAFNQWVENWSEASGISVTIPQEHLTIQPKQLKKLKVISKTKTNVDNTFLITLKPKKHHQFTSGDLLAIYPKNDYRERLYSIGKVNGTMQLSIKLHENGLGSEFLHSAADGDKIKARLVKNSAFHFPKKTKQVFMIANGTGVAPFLGMLQQNKNIETHLYLGLRTQESFRLYQEQIKQLLFDGKLTKHHLALSRVGDKHYVQDFLKRDAKTVAKLLYNNGVIMICGSLAMHKSVMSVLEEIAVTYNNKPLSYYQNKQQIKSDCY